MGLGFHHMGDHERPELLGGIDDFFHLEPDHGQRLADLLGRGGGVEMFFQPVESELHL